MAYDLAMVPLKELYRTMGANYHTLKAQSASLIERWEFTGGRRHHPVPFYFEKNGFARGKISKDPAKATFSYGFDVKGRVIVERAFAGSQHAFDEEIFVCLPEAVESVRFDPNKQVISVSRQTFENGSLAAYEECTQVFHTAYSERFFWHGGRLVRSEYSPLRDAPLIFTYDYDEEGGMVRIDVAYKEYPDQTETRYRKRKKGEDPRQTAALVHRLLVEHIPLLVKGAGVTEPAFCVALVYDGGEPAAPPLIGVGLDSERRKIGPSDAWLPAEWAHYETDALQFTDAELLKACRLLNDQLAEKAAPIRKLFNAVAAELNTIPWHQNLPVTDDFLIVAVDYEAADLRANLRAALTPERFAFFKNKL